MKIQKLLEDAVIPTRGSEKAAGLDLYAMSPCTLYPHTMRVIATGIAIALPAGTYGRIAPRSGLAVKWGIDVLAGVVDEDYRGEILVALINHGETAFTINRGDRIAQLIVESIVRPVIEVVTDLQETERGSSGFGSTGI